MKNLLTKTLNPIKKIYGRLGLIKTLLIILTIIAIIVLIRIFGSSDPLTNTDNLREVQIEYVLNLSSENVPLSLIGKVESKNEADLRAETSGEVTGVYATLGQYVYAGQVLAEISNARERAGVLQAKASLDIAESNLVKLTSGARGEEKDILVLSVSGATEKLEQSKISAVNTINNVFAVVDDIIFNKVDEIFVNPRAENPRLNFTVPDQSLAVKIEDGRASVGKMLSAWETKVNQTTVNSDLIKTLEEANDNLDIMRVFINDVTRAVNTVEANIDITATEVATRRANMVLARNSLNSTISTVTSEINSLRASITALEVAKKNQEIGFVGGRDEDVTVSEALVSQARAGLRSAEASLEKTIIRTPISGTLSLLAVKRGDFVSMYAPVAMVSNNNTLVVTTYVTEDESKDIHIGDEVGLKAKSTGIISAIAPSLNPVTKKIEVTINPKENSDLLVNGETVRISLDRKTQITSSDLPTEIRIPIKALKIEPTRTIVFSVNRETNTLVAHTVVLGPIVGENIIIDSGINFGLEIVTDARGLKENEKIIVQ